MNFAQLCTQSLVDAVKTHPDIGAKVMSVYSRDDATGHFSKSVITLPAAGVIYEGTRSVGDNRSGVSAEILCSILLLADNSKALTTNTPTMDRSLELLDEVRKIILGTRSPTAHFWKFVLEAPAFEAKNSIVWLQRWSTPVQVISKAPTP